jgi:hypothetical protein
MPAIDVLLLNHSMTILPYSNSGSPRVKRDGKFAAEDCTCLSFFTGDGLGCPEIDEEYESSYESDILDMYRRAAARSAPLSKDFCASLAQADCWEDWGTAMVAASRATSRIAAAALRKGSPSAVSTLLFQQSSRWLSRFLAVSLPSFVSATLRPRLHALS